MRLMFLALIAFFSFVVLFGAVGLWLGATYFGVESEGPHRMGSKREIDAAIHRRGRA